MHIDLACCLPVSCAAPPNQPAAHVLCGVCWQLHFVGGWCCGAVTEAPGCNLASNRNNFAAAARPQVRLFGRRRLFQGCCARLRVHQGYYLVTGRRGVSWRAARGPRCGTRGGFSSCFFKENHELNPPPRFLFSVLGFLATRTVCSYLIGRRWPPPAHGSLACSPRQPLERSCSGWPFCWCVGVFLLGAPVGSMYGGRRGAALAAAGEVVVCFCGGRGCCGRYLIPTHPVLTFDLICTQHKWVGRREAGGLCAAGFRGDSTRVCMRAQEWMASWRLWLRAAELQCTLPRERDLPGGDGRGIVRGGGTHAGRHSAAVVCSAADLRAAVCCRVCWCVRRERCGLHMCTCQVPACPLTCRCVQHAAAWGCCSLLPSIQVCQSA